MNRYLLTSPKFTGSIELVYLDESIVRVDFLDSSADDRQKRYIFQHIPLTEASLAQLVEAVPGLVCVAADYEITLEDFKREYPYSRNTHLLPPLWEKLKASERVLIWMKAREYRKYCERNANWYKPKIAAKWIKDKEYLNDWKNL